MPIASDVRRPSCRGSGFVLAGLLLGLSLVPLRLEAQCSITGGPVLFDPLGANIDASWKFSPRFNSLALYQSGAGGPYRVVDRYNYGYTVFSLSNPLSPSLLSASDIHSVPGYINSADGQTNTTAVGAAPDGSSLLVGYLYGGHATMFLAPSAPEGHFDIQDKDFKPSWGVSSSGGMRVDKIGSRSIAYTVESSTGLWAADISAGTPSPNGFFSSEMVSNAPITGDTVGLDLAVNGVTGQRYVVYSTGQDSPNSKIVVVNVSNPGAAGAGITANFAVTVFDAVVDLGLPSGSYVRRTRAAFHPNGTLQILMEATNRAGQSAAIVLKAFSTANGRVVATGTPISYTDPTSPYLAPNSFSTTSGPALVATADDLLVFTWEVARTGMKLFTFSSNGGGTDLTPQATWPLTNTKFFPSGNSSPPMMTEGWNAGQDFYLVTGGWSAMNVTKVTCQATSTPATASQSVTNQAGVEITSAFIGDTVTWTRNVSPSPVASSTTALTGWDIDFDYHDPTEKSTASGFGLLQFPDVTKVQVPKTVAGITGQVTDPATYPASLTFTGPCDPRNFSVDRPTCWQSVATTDFSALTGISPVTSPYVIRMEDEGVKTASTVFAFEAANGNTTGTSSTGSANLATLPFTWKVPRVLIQKGSPNSGVADTTPAAANQTILVGDKLYNASEGSPSLSGYSWYFETAPGSGKFGAADVGCTGPSCLHDFAAAAGASPPPRPWTFAYWLTVPYPNGYVSEDYPAGLPDVATTRKRGTINVNDVVLSFTVPPSVVKNVASVPVTNGSARSSSVLSCPSDSAAYQYAICQETTAGVPCTVLDTDYANTITFAANNAGIFATPVPTSPATYPAKFWLRIRYNYVASGSCPLAGTAPLTAYWTPGVSTSDSTAWPLTVTAVAPGIDIRKSTSAGTSYTKSCNLSYWTGCPTTGQALVAVAVDTSKSPWADLVDPSFTWSLGDGLTRTGSPSQSFSYSTTGTKALTLTAYGVTATSAIVVNVAPTPTPSPTPSPTPTPTPPPSNGDPAAISSFTASPSSAKTGQAVTFSCNATGSPAPTYWMSLGDGSQASSSYATHTYNTPGTFTANCQVSNAYGSDSRNATVNVTQAVQVWNPKIHVWVNGKDPCKGNPYCLYSQFSAAVGDTLTAYAWDQTTGAKIPDTGAGTFAWTFSHGSPASATVQGATFSYTQAGTFTNDVKLTFHPSNGTPDSTDSASASIEGPPLPPVTLEIRASPSNGAVGSPIAFTATAGGGSGTYSSYTWDFGDQGAAGSGASASHTYTKAGTFTVTCTVLDAAGPTQTATTSVTVASVQLWLVPGVAWVSGQGGAEWRSDLSIFNPSPTSSMALQIALLDGAKPIASIADLNGKWKTVSVSPQATKAFTNIISSLFNLGQGNYGAVLVRGDSSVATQPVINGSTYDVSRGAGGTVGLSLSATSLPSGAGLGIQAAGSTLELVGLRDDTTNHTNLAIANLYSDYVTAEVTLWATDGTQLGQPVTMQLNPFGVLQLTNILTGTPPNGGAGYDKVSKPVDAYRAHIRIVSGTAILPYASVIDDVSKDPVLVMGAKVQTSSYRVPGMVRTAGKVGTLWRSDLVVYNASTSARSIRINYSWVDGGGTARSSGASISFAAGQIIQWIDFVKLWLGLSEIDTNPYINAFVDISPADANADPILVTSRVYNNQPTGNVGLGVPGYTDADVASASGPKKRLILAGLRSDSNYRSNVALFLASGSSVSSAGATLKVYDVNGTFLASAGIPLSWATPFAQLSIDTMVAGSGGDKSNISVVVENLEGSPISGYATIVDNRSGDGTLIPALPIP